MTGLLVTNQPISVVIHGSMVQERKTVKETGYVSAVVRKVRVMT